MNPDISWILYKLRKEGFTVALGDDPVLKKEVIGISPHVRGMINWLPIPAAFNRDLLLSQLRKLL